MKRWFTAQGFAMSVAATAAAVAVRVAGGSFWLALAVWVAVLFGLAAVAP